MINLLLPRLNKTSRTPLAGFNWANFLLLTLAIANGCDSSARTDRASSDSKSVTQNGNISATQRVPHAAPILYRDRLDREVQFEHAPSRIVSLSPETTELLFAVGAGDRIVGATEYCTYPEAARSIPRVGQGTADTISREQVVASKPDLILCRWDAHQTLLNTFERLNIPILAIGPESTDELLQEARDLGNLLQLQDEAGEFIARFEDRLSALLAQAQTVLASSSDNPPKVFYEVWDSPLMTAGPNSFIGRLITMAKCENIFNDVTVPYPQVNAETIIERKPTIILFPANANTSEQELSSRVQSIVERPGWSQIPAIVDRKIFAIESDSVSRCGPRMLDGLEAILQNVYPQHAYPSQQ